MSDSAKTANNTAQKSVRMPTGRIIACCGIIAFMIMMLVKPEFYLDSARRGLSLYATSVLPSLFPFYFFSLLLTYIGAAKTVSGIFQKPVRLLYNAPKESSYILLLSMLSGYPVGASMTAELYESGVITQNEAKAISSFASTSGPIFILGTVGSAVFNNVKIGAIILAAHYISALLNGVIFRIRRSGASKHMSKRNPRNDNNVSSSIFKPTAMTVDNDVTIAVQSTHDSVMSRTIASSTLSMLYVGGYIVLCGMLVDTLSLFKINELLISAVGEVSAQPLIALLNGLIEMTRGSIACAECVDTRLGIALCAGIISLGGLSVTLQNYTFLSRCGMTFIQIVLRKSTQSLIAFGIAFALSFLT